MEAVGCGVEPAVNLDGALGRLSQLLLVCDGVQEPAVLQDIHDVTTLVATATDVSALPAGRSSTLGFPVMDVELTWI
eukprot:363592-Pyramimonas_sp.AAC.2